MVPLEHHFDFVLIIVPVVDVALHPLARCRPAARSRPPWPPTYVPPLPRVHRLHGVGTHAMEARKARWMLDRRWMRSPPGMGRMELAHRRRALDAAACGGRTGPVPCHAPSGQRAGRAVATGDGMPQGRCLRWRGQAGGGRWWPCMACMRTMSAGPAEGQEAGRGMQGAAWANGTKRAGPALSACFFAGLQFHEYLVLGRGLPTEKKPQPTIYRMRIFAPNALVAKSKFWYFMKRLSDVKKMTGEILSCTEVRRWAGAGRAPEPLGTLPALTPPAVPRALAGRAALRRSWRRSRRPLRTSASGSATTRGAAPTTCTRSTAS